MWYQGMEKTEIHRLAVAEFAEPEYALFNAYVRLREQGLRGRAFAELEVFITQALGWPLGQRAAFVDRLLMFLHVNHGYHDVTPTPLNVRLLLPTLTEWIGAEPLNPVPRRWRAVVAGGDNDETLDDLRAAIALDAAETIARHRLIDIHHEAVDFSIHELPNGWGYCCDPERDLVRLEEAETVIGQLPPSKLRDSHAREAAYLRSVVTAYIRFSSLKAEGTFRDWAPGQGLVLERRWSGPYFYQ